MATVKVDVAPSVLVWARESMGLSLEEAAQRVKLDALSLRFYEEGVGDPTFSLIERMSKAYERPLIAFFLPDPPEDVDRMPDFRLLPRNQSRSWSPEMHQAFRRVRAQRESAVAMVDAAGDHPPEPPVSLHVGDDPEEAGQELRRLLDAPAPDQLSDMTPGRVFQAWSRAVERQAVLVAQVEQVSIDEMRGFSLSDRPFPAIAVNANDAIRGRVFTLAHELCHVLMRDGGLCDLAERRKQPKNQKERLERFCNQVAAAVLMPRNEVLLQPIVRATGKDHKWSDQELVSLSNTFGVSAEAMLLRLVTLDRASMDFYFRRRQHFLATYEAQRRRKEQAKSSGGGLTYYERKLRNYGRRFVQMVVDAYDQEQINGADLAHYLDMKLNNLPKLVEAMDKG